MLRMSQMPRGGCFAFSRLASHIRVLSNLKSGKTTILGGATPLPLRRGRHRRELRTSIAAKHREIRECQWAQTSVRNLLHLLRTSRTGSRRRSSRAARRDEAGFVHIECMVQVAVSQVGHRGNVIVSIGIVRGVFPLAHSMVHSYESRTGQ